MFVCRAKAFCECFRQELEAFPKVPNSPKFSASLAMGFLEKKKHAAELPVSQGTERMRLFLSSSWAFWYRWCSLCKKTPHTYPTHYTHAYTFNSERELSCLVRCCSLADHEEGEAEVKKVESLLLCLGKRAVLELQAVHDQLLWLFDNVRKLLKQELHKSFLEHSWSECSSSTSRLIWSPKRHFVAIDLPVAEKTPKCMCYPILGQRKLKANNVDRQLTSKKAQSSSCFDLDSDRQWQFLFRDRQKFRYRFGENPRNWGIPFSRPISARLFILAPGPFPATQYDKEPGGAGFEATKVQSRSGDWI